MLTFDEYYGYKKKDKGARQNNHQRSEKSTSRNAESGHKKPRRQKNTSGDRIDS